MTHTQTTTPSRLALLLGIFATILATTLRAQTIPPQQLALAGLRSVASQGQFNAIQSDPSGNLYLLLDQKDGVRILKTDPTASTLIAQAHIGAKGDIGVALALDPAGNVYVTGTTTSGQLAGSSGTPFPTVADTSTNSFLARFTSTLTPLYVTFAGSGHLATTSIAATPDAVFVTGSIFANTLPVTPSAILQSPASGSAQNGFVEKFSADGSTLLYATYLSGAYGNTSPASIAADPSDNAYITGYTSASGYPTLAALVPEILAPTSGFLTKLTPGGDGITFSTFLPGSGLTSIAYDPTQQNLLLSGSIALGQFPIAQVATPLVNTAYQSAIRLSLDGTTLLSSTLLAPGSQSFVSPSTAGSTWVAGSLTSPLLPLPALSTTGNSYATHLLASGSIDQTARFGGLPANNPAYTAANVNLTSLITDPSGQPILVGSFNPATSSSLLPTQTYDLSLTNNPSNVLPSTVHDAVLPPGTCNGSFCAGSAAYLARFNSTAAPALSFSVDDAPNLTLRNLGSVQATGLQITATGFTLASNCGFLLAPGSECSIALTGSGPGTITVQSSNAATQVASIPALTTSPLPVVVSPKELDFGIQTSGSTAVTRTLTVTNLTQQSQTFLSALDAGPHSATPYTLSESSSDCTTSGLPTNKVLAPGGSCHITLALTASSSSANDGFLQANWSIGTRDVLLTGYAQAASLTTSASEIDFGTQYTGALRLPRFLYLSNSSTNAISHTPVSLTAASPFSVEDHCPTLLEPRTVCQLQLNYESPVAPSSDATTLTLDQGLTVLVTGRTLSPPNANGASVNPNLSITPTTITFPNAVPVTGTSSSVQVVAIANTGATPFPLALTLSGDFTDTTNCPVSLPGGDSCSVILTFAPTQSGTRQGLLSVTAGANSTPAYVTLGGVATSILDAPNGTLDFGQVIIGQPSVQWYKITQPFTNFTASTTGDYNAILVEDLGFGHGQPPSSAFLPTTTGTCINCWLGLQFIPSAAGARAGTLTLSSSVAGIPSTISLNGVGLPLTGLLLTPVSQDFGPVPIHSTSSTTLFTLTNLTTSAVTLSAPAVTGDFAVSSASSGGQPCSGTLAVSASCFVQIDFAPTAPGQRNGTLTIASNASTASAPLSGFGSPDPGVALNPTALVFRNVPGPTSTTQTVTVTNTGSSTIQIGTPTTGTSRFAATSLCSALAPSASCNLSVTFTPTTANAVDLLQIPASTTGNSPTISTYTVSLTGAYTMEDAGLQILPNQANFGPNLTSTLGLTRQFTINNLTNKSLTLAVAFPRQFILSGPPCSGLAPYASCNFSATFLPLTNGDITGTLFAQANPSDGTATLNALGYLEGYGNGSGALTITGNLSPGQLLNFGQVNSGQSVSQTLTLANRTSPTPITVRRITSEWPFLTTSTCGQPLALNQSCTVTITYTPLNQLVTGSSPLPGNDAGTLVLESDALTSPDLVDLAGTSAPVLVSTPSNAAPLASYTASQSSLTFADTTVGNASTAQIVTLSNTGNTTLHVLSLKTSADFSVANGCTALVPGGSCNLSLTFTPQLAPAQTTTQLRIGALEILSDASSSLDFISLLGSANPSTLSLAPTSLDFGTVLVGSTATLPLQVTNTGTTAVLFNALTTTGDYTADGSCPSSGNPLPAATSCTIQVTFAPTASGTRPGTLALATSASALPLTIPLTGTGAQSHLQVTPSTLNFGSIALGASANLTLTLANTGTAPLSNLTLGISGDYALTVPCALTTLAPGASCSATITFVPTSIGPRNSALTITSSDSTSPLTIPLTGAGVGNGSFTLTVDGGTTSSASVISGHPASYTLTLTPQNFTGTVVINCVPVNPALYASCSLLPSSISLTNTPQNAVATINTITEVTLARNAPGPHADQLGSLVLCLLTPSLFLFWRTRTTPRSPRATLFVTLLTAAALATLLSASGCGSGGDPSLRYSVPGTYQYQVTANSTTGVQLTRTVTLNLTVQPR
jgi:hypothetical protein